MPNWGAIDSTICERLHCLPVAVDTMTLPEIEFLLMRPDGNQDRDAIWASVDEWRGASLDDKVAFLRRKYAR